jgi:clan AA aspartic protease (TIGR02281 family)
MKTIIAAVLLCGVASAAMATESPSKSREAFLSAFRWEMNDEGQLGAQPLKKCDQVKCWSVMARREPQFDGSWLMTSLTTEAYFSGAVRRFMCNWGASHPDRAGCDDENGMFWSEELVGNEWRVLKVIAKGWDDPIRNKPLADDFHEVSVDVDGTRVFAPVSLGSNFTFMLLDTGCTSMTVTETAAANLTTSKEAVFDLDEDITFANGATERHKTIRINEVAIGKHVLHDVRAAVTPDGADMLLGFGVLNQISSKFSIDTAEKRLTFEAEADPARPQQPTAQAPH